MTTAVAFPHQDDTVLNCTTTDPEVFHDDAQADLAKKLCEDCPLAQACRSRARAHREWGTWGGETTAERAARMEWPRPPTGEPPLRHPDRIPSAHPRQGEAVHIVQGSRIMPPHRLHTAPPAPHAAPTADHRRRLNPAPTATVHHDGPTNRDADDDLPQARPADRP
ncbi:WhiB family transcriptional regulator [Streptomyces sp. NPDC055025]